MADAAADAADAIGMNYGGRIQWDGAFTINNVAPGRYILRARGDDTETPQFAAQPISVNGGDLADVTVMLSAGATISGTVSFLPGRLAGARLHAVPDHGAVDRPVGRSDRNRTRASTRTGTSRSAASRPART